MVVTTQNTKRYVGRTPRAVPPGRIIVHNHVRPGGFPDVPVEFQGFRAWTDVPKPKGYRVVACRCGWAPDLRHYRVRLERAKKDGA